MSYIVYMWGLISPLTIDSQGNLDSSPLQTKLASTAPAGINTTRTTRSSVANNKQIGQNKGGNITIIYTTAKALKDNEAKKRAVSKRNQQSGSAQVIFLVTPLPVNIWESDFYRWEYFFV